MQAHTYKRHANQRDFQDLRFKTQKCGVEPERRGNSILAVPLTDITKGSQRYFFTHTRELRIKDSPTLLHTVIVFLENHLVPQTFNKQQDFLETVH